MIAPSAEMLVTDRRRRSSERRKKIVIDDAPDANDTCESECTREITDRRKADRRRQIDPTTCERDYSGAEVQFMRAMDDYKRKSGRPFPTWSEVLEVLMSLGYRQVAEPNTMEWRTAGD
ncbi:MAG: hypothetical protein R3C19_08885 [Planctomycetaceae bacterium]